VSRINPIRITRSNSNSTSHAINYNETGLLNVDHGLERDTYRIIIGHIQTYRDVPGYDALRVQQRVFTTGWEPHIQMDLVASHLGGGEGSKVMSSVIGNRRSSSDCDGIHLFGNINS
jgi:hypothetical protein